eukprot:6675487-Lingulodinium_polyedra.AAC.1
MATGERRATNPLSAACSTTHLRSRSPTWQRRRGSAARLVSSLQRRGSRRMVSCAYGCCLTPPPTSRSLVAATSPLL